MTGSTRKLFPNEKRRTWRRDQYRCRFCGVLTIPFAFLPTSSTVDHLIPRSRGGTNHPDNLVTACHECNQAKGDRTPAEAGMHPLPIGSTWVPLGRRAGAVG